jgi:hypothetical protein
MKKILFVFIPILFCLSFAGCSKDNKGTASTANETGQGGSLARFTISNGYLYVIEMQELKAFSLTDPTNPALTKSVHVDLNAETIFVFEDKLFIGSQSAMYIYSIANPSSPQYLGQASHVRACDPVIANQDYAYVTVRSGTNCGGTVNALYVYDVSNILYPQQLNVIPLETPFGLGMRGNRLYVCDGGNGLQVYNINNPEYPSFIKKVSGEIFYDIIIDDADDLLICMVEGGTAIYSINGDDITKLSKIVN